MSGVNGGPFTTLFNCAQFQNTFIELLKDLPDPDGLGQMEVDLSTDDVQMVTKFEQIEREIKKELLGKKETDQPENPDQALMEKNAEQLISVKDPNKDFPQIRRKEVNYITSQMSHLTEEDREPEAVSPTEIIISVAFYHQEKGIKSQEYLVLGSQPLTALKERFYCLSDHILDGPSTKSSFFFIENTFYNDFRDPNALDYSRDIIEWVNQNNRFTHPNLGIFTSKSMADTTFRDLSIRMGAQYVYVHQGNCQHIFTFSNLRLISNQDNQDKNVYPLHIFQCKIRRKKCRVCDINPAKFVTYGDKLADENPYFYCDKCYRPFHYSYEGQLLYQDFEVYPYYHE